MIVKFNYKELLQNILDLSVVINDSNVDDDVKNIVFLVGEDTLSLVGQNKFIVYKIAMKEFSVVNKTKDMFLVRCKDLLRFLETYKNTKVTEVKTVIMELGKNNRIKTSVIEGLKNSDKEYTTNFYIDEIEPRVGIITTIEVPEVVTKIESNDLKKYIRVVGNVIQNKSNLYGFLVIDKDYLITFNPAFTLLIKNEFDFLKGIKLPYKDIIFITKVLSNDTEIEIGVDKKLYIKDGEDREAQLTFQRNLPQYQVFIDKLTEEREEIKVNREHFLEILKRVSLTKENAEIEIDIEDKKVKVKNNKIIQETGLEIPNKFSKGIRFKAVGDIIEKSIINFNKEITDLNIGYVEEGNLIILSDDTKSWYSIIRIKIF